jgi:arsenite-transporting ATPase
MRSFGKNNSMVSHVTTPLMHLKDPTYTKILIVTLAETTPISEATALQTDLRRAGIEPFAWIMNNCIPMNQTSDPLLVRRAQSEAEQIKRARNGLAKKIAMVPWFAESLIGIAHLRKIVQPTLTKEIL